MKNTLTLKPLIDDGFRVEYMVGNLETAHGTYDISVSEGRDGGFFVTLTNKHVIYANTFRTIRTTMDSLLTFVENDKRFLKVTD